MSDFILAYNIVKKNEGGYANNPDDKGGETFKGIARKIFPNWKGWILIDASKSRTDIDFKTLVEADINLSTLVKQFYKQNFWDVLSMDKITHQLIANELFDTAVNMGVGTAGKFLQRSLNVLNKRGTLYPNLLVDGVVGPKTIEVLNKSNQNIVYKILNCLQGAKYVAICEVDESQESFMYGWMNRVFEVNLQ